MWGGVCIRRGKSHPKPRNEGGVISTRISLLHPPSDQKKNASFHRAGALPD